MSISDDISALTAATTALMEAVDVKKTLLDNAVEAAESVAQSTAASTATSTAEGIVQTTLNDLAATASGKGAALLGFKQAGADTVARTVFDKLTDFRSLLDFGTVDLTGVTDASSVMTKALASGYPILLPPGTIRMSVEIPSNSVIVGSGRNKTIIKPPSGSTTRALKITGVNHVFISDLSVDGAKTVKTGEDLGLIHASAGFWDVHLHNLDIRRSSEIGLLMVGGADKANHTHSSVTECDVFFNSHQGIRISESACIDVVKNIVHDNVHHGIACQPMTWPPGTYAVEDVNIDSNRVFNNIGAGIYTTPLIKYGTSFTEFSYSHTEEQYCRSVTVSNNHVHDNSATGIMAGGYNCSYVQNRCIDNGSSSPWAGIVFSAHSSICNDNVCTGNATYGIDCGGSIYCTVSGNTINRNAVGASFCIGLNVGATSHCVITGNSISMNGSDDANTTQLCIAGWDGDGTYAYTQIGGGNIISNNQIRCYPNNYGIRSHWQPRYNKINDNYIAQCSRENAIVNRTAFAVSGHHLDGNIHDLSLVSGYPSIASAATVIIDDYGSIYTITGTVSITNLFTKSRSDYDGKITDGVVSNSGSGYTSQPTVSFSGGGGTGAAADAEISRSGTVVAIKMTNYGSGYTSAPTISISGGGGTGAAASAILGCINHTNRRITLVFEGATTIQVPGMNTSFTTQAGSTLTLVGKSNGQWMEVSRSF